MRIYFAGEATAVAGGSLATRSGEKQGVRVGFEVVHDPEWLSPRTMLRFPECERESEFLCSAPVDAVTLSFISSG